MKVLSQFAGIPELLGNAFEVDPKTLHATFHRVEHHQAHLASTFFVSPFENAAALSADGLGDFASTMWANGEGTKLNVLGSIAFPHSLGMYYTALTQYMGFWKFGDEYKVMGLAAYGQPEFLESSARLCRQWRRRIQLGLDYFTHHRTGPEMSWRDAIKLPCSAECFRNIWNEGLGRRVPRTNLFRSGITTLRRRCRRGWKKSILTCCANCKNARDKNRFALRAA